MQVQFSTIILLHVLHILYLFRCMSTCLLSNSFVIFGSILTERERVGESEGERGGGGGREGEKHY